MADNHRVMVYDGQSLFQWHANRNVVPNEKLMDSDRKRVGYFQLHNGNWILVNQGLPSMKDVTANVSVAIGQHVTLVEGQQILLSAEPGGRLIHVQLVGG